MYEYISHDGIHIKVGENAKENVRLTESAHPDDWWMHVVDTPGAHVVISYNKESLPKETVNDAATLAAHHSQSKTMKKVVVHVTKAGYVTPGKHMGQVKLVEISNVTNISMYKEQGRLERLLKTRVHKNICSPLIKTGLLSYFGRK